MIKFIHCYKICGSNYRYCRQRRTRTPCRKLRETLQEEHAQHVKERNVRIEQEFTIKKFDSMGDIFDSKGDDISKEEFLENEKFWEMM